MLFFRVEAEVDTFPSIQTTGRAVFAVSRSLSNYAKRQGILQCY